MNTDLELTLAQKEVIKNMELELGISVNSTDNEWDSLVSDYMDQGYLQGEAEEMASAVIESE